MSFGLFVAPRTTIRSGFDNNPSHNLNRRVSFFWGYKSTSICGTYVMNSAFIIPVASWSSFCLCRKNESISSMNTMLGCVLRASEKRAAMSLFESPNHLLVSTEAAMFIKVAPDSFASALASIVLPQPGGPNKSTPFGAPSSEEEEKRWGYWRGYITDSRRDAIMGSKPPMSA